MEHHVDRPTQMGARVLINDGWYYYRFDVATGTLEASCEASKFVSYTALGTAFHKFEPYVSDTIRNSLDPGARRLEGYLKGLKTTVMPSTPPRSKYYADVHFLERFGLISGERHPFKPRHSDEVGFIAANEAAEPSAALNGHCG